MDFQTVLGENEVELVLQEFHNQFLKRVSVREKSFAMSARHATTAKYEPMRVIFAMRWNTGRDLGKSAQIYLQGCSKDSAFWKRFIPSPFSEQGNM